MSGLDQQAQLADLARHLRGGLTGPWDPGWDETRRPWNLRVDQRPLAVVDAADAGDIAATAAFAASNGLQVTVQATGHGAGDTLDNTILIRTRRFRDITVDPARQRVRVGAGVRCNDLLAAAGPHGLALSIGSAPDAGVAGYAMFGGVGRLGRTLGFTAGQVLAADVVTADGSLVHADEEAHADLLWALRGGGGGFALVTQMELRLARLPGLFGGELIWPAAAAPEVLGAWRSWTEGLPPEMTSSAYVAELPPLPEIPEVLRGRRIAAVIACYAGPPGEGAALLKPLRQLGAPLADRCRPLTPADLVTLLGAPPFPLPSRIQSVLLDQLPEAAISEFLRHTVPGSGSPLVAEIRHLGGAFADPVSGSAYPPAGPDGVGRTGSTAHTGAIGRTSAQFLVEIASMVPTPEADAGARGFQQSVISALGPWSTGMTLPSFAPPPADAGQVFTEETQLRLAEVKRRYDPTDVIRSSFPAASRQQRS